MNPLIPYVFGVFAATLMALVVCALIGPILSFLVRAVIWLKGDPLRQVTP